MTAPEPTRADVPPPGAPWPAAAPERAGFDRARLADAHAWLADAAGEAACRVGVYRHGLAVAEWCRGLPPSRQVQMASAAKSVYSCMLGIAVREGRIGSADDRVVDYYPEMMDVPEGRGPKPGRHAKPDDRDITFRQLISNTSGYMKPDEPPGSTFHYQTFGMNIICHALAVAHGLYDSADPARLPGPGALAERMIRDPIGASWSSCYSNFPHPPEALTGIFGNYLQLSASLDDLARLGRLWLDLGRWGDRQVVPDGWLREAVRTAPEVHAASSAARGERFEGEALCYGYGFWTNEPGLLWPSLPRDSFAASGAGRIHVWVCPSLDLVVVQSPGVYTHQRDNDSGLLGRIVAALA